MPELPEAATIEIIETTDSPNPWCIVPNEIRINGKPVLAPADRPVEVHAITASANEPVLVTLTLYAKRVTFATEQKGGE
jgi:hypothetical protein